MNYRGIARRAALKLILLTLLVVAAVACAGFLIELAGTMAKFAGLALVWLAVVLAVVWVLFSLFTIYFFRDPNPRVPVSTGVVVSPAHGKVDVVEQLVDSQVPGGPCHRISIFLSVIDVHVQNAPISGKVERIVHTVGQFINALKAESAQHNENVLIGFASSETPGEKVGIRLIAGVLARRIIPFIKVGEELRRGDRISLIQFGSRCDVYLPLRYKVSVRLGDRVVGGETVLANASL
jgi:phosphatidylserine decarboxylase